MAPMAGVNDIAFRELCIECGAKLTYTEMISSKGLDYHDNKTLSLLKLSNSEDKVVVQLFGHEPKTMAKQANFVREKLGDKLAYIDINMGCPAKKIVKKGDGSALMDNPNLASDIVKACSESGPVTVKFRKSNNTIAFAKLMEKSGASAICVHGRYPSQFYKGRADWDIIKSIRDVVSISLIGSGDINDYNEAKSKLKVCDAVMVGRAARGNPWVFSNRCFTNAEKIKLARKHLLLYSGLYGQNMSHMRKHCMWYVKGMPGASIARDEFTKCKSLEDFYKVFQRMENYERV